MLFVLSLVARALARILGVEAVAEGRAVVQVKHRALEALHERVQVRGTRRELVTEDTEAATRPCELTLELRPAIHHHLLKGDPGLGVGGCDVALEELGRGPGALLAAADLREAERAGPVDRRVLPDLAHPFQPADEHGVQEHLLTEDIRADVAVLDLPGPQVAQRPLGDGTALGGRQGLRRGKARAHPGKPGPVKDVGHPAVGDGPGPEPRQRERGGDRPWSHGGVVDRVGDDLIDQRRREPAVRTLGGPGLGQQTGFSVGQVALAELVVTAAGDAERPTRLGHRQPAAHHQVQHLLSKPCKTRRRSQGRLLPVECCLNGGSMPLASFLLWEVPMSGFNVGTTD